VQRVSKEQSQSPPVDVQTQLTHLPNVEQSVAKRLQHFFPQAWLLIFSLTVFALAVLWDLGFLQAMIALDRSHITLVIGGLLIISTCHAAWHIVIYSQLIEMLSHDENRNRSPERTLETAFPELSKFENQADIASHNLRAQREVVIEVIAENRRAPVDLGWFLVDLAIRLGLVGTIIGFILIFTSLSSVTIDGADGLKELMIAMSGGMGTALFTTLCGLVAGTLMSFQYLILGRQTEHLIGLLIKQNAIDTIANTSQR